MSKRKPLKFTNATADDGHFLEVGGLYAVKRTLKTTEEVTLLHSRLPEQIQTYQNIVTLIDPLLVAMRARAQALTASSTDRTAPMCTQTHADAQAESPNSSLLTSEPADKEVAKDDSPGGALTHGAGALFSSDIYHRYLEDLGGKYDFTLPWPPTPERLREKLSHDLVDMATEFYADAERGEAKIESHIWRKAMAAQMSSTVAKRKAKLFAGSRLPKELIYTRVDVATVGESRLDPSSPPDESVVAVGVPTNQFPRIATGWFERDACRAALRADLKQSFFDTAESAQRESMTADNNELPWFMPVYLEPFASGAGEEEAPVHDLISEAVKSRDWIAATEKVLSLAQAAVTHACADG